MPQNRHEYRMFARQLISHGHAARPAKPTRLSSGPGPRRLLELLIGLMVILPGIGRPAAAINIQLNFDTNNTESPNFDRNGSGLVSMFQFAEQFYEDVFQDADHTIQIDFWYENLSDTTLGLHNTISVFGRETYGTIRIDTLNNGGALRNWFIDATPQDNSEFNLQQTLWRDLSSSQKSDWYSHFSSALPETFEVGFRGLANTTSIQGQLDMLSTVLHEVGHALGMSSGNTATLLETVDGDYDFNPDFIFGESLAVETANVSGDDNLNVPHLENPNTLMFPAASQGFRTLPSHTDLLAMAAGHNYVNLDVPRREFYGNSNWQNSNNWTGNKVPGALDDVFIRDAQGSDTTLTARLNANGVARNVTVSEGANLDTNSYKLDASGDVVVTGTDSDIFVEPGGELEGDEVFIRNSAEIEMSGGTLDVRRLTIETGTQIEGTQAGAVAIDVSSRLTNDGEIDANGSSVMTFTSVAANPWDLDGASEDGIVDARDGDIDFVSGGLTDSFSGTMKIGGGHSVSLAAPWTTSSNGNVTINGDGTLVGGQLTMAGELEVTGERAVILAPLSLTNPGTIHVTSTGFLEQHGSFSHDSGRIFVEEGGRMLVKNGATISGVANADIHGSLAFQGPTLFADGSYQGRGRISFSDSATISPAASIEIGSMYVTGMSELLVDGGTVATGELIVQGGRIAPDTATLRVEAGGLVDVLDPSASAGMLHIGGDSSNVSQVVVRGVAGSLRSRINVEGSIWLGRGQPSMGILTISDGGRVTAGANVSIGGPDLACCPGFTGEGHVTVGRAFRGFDAELVAQGDVIVGQSNTGGPASLTIDDGGRVEANELKVWTVGTVDVNGGELSLHSFHKESGATFNHQGGTISISGGDGVFNSGFAYEGLQANVPTFVIEDGADVAVTTYWQVGDAAGGHGVTQVRGTSSDGSRRSTLRGTSSGDLRVGDAGTGTLLIEDGGLVALRDDTEIARGTVDSEGTVTVRGVADAGGNLIRSELRVSGNGSGSILNVGRAGQATLNIEDGALVLTSSSANVGALAGSVGEVNIGGAMSGFAAELDVATAVLVGNSGTGTVNISDGGRLHADELIVWAGSEVNLNGGELSLKRLDVDTHRGIVNITGNSIYDVDQIDGDFDMEGGTITPGDSPGIMTVNGNYTTAGTALEIEIGGLVAGTEFDRVEVSGTASIDGMLDVQLFDLGGGLFVPDVGDAFEIFSAAGGIAGEFLFDTATAPLLPDGRLWNVDYGTNEVLLQVVAAFDAVDFDADGDSDIDDLNAMLAQGPVADGVPVDIGVNEQFDLNGDGFIDDADVDQWLSEAATGNGFGSPYKRGDANLDGVVDASDFNLWNANKFTDTLLWDNGNFNGDGVADASDFNQWNVHKFTVSDSLAAVPEPATGWSWLIALALVALTQPRSRRLDKQIW